MALHSGSLPFPILIHVVDDCLVRSVDEKPRAAVVKLLYSTLHDLDLI